MRVPYCVEVNVEIDTDDVHRFFGLVAELAMSFTDNLDVSGRPANDDVSWPHPLTPN